MPSPDGDGGVRETELPDDVVSDLLRADRRRYALEVLAERDSEIVIDDLAATALARERETDPDAIDTDERRDVRDEFFQDHLPKLTATEVVRYNSMLGTVELAKPDAVEAALERS